MSIYNAAGEAMVKVYAADGAELDKAYNANGVQIYQAGPPQVDYSQYSYTQKWASKGIGNTQGFDIYDGKVFWVSKSGNATVPADCYVWNLSDGSQALDTPTITIYSGHGNNLCFDWPTLYATSAYTPTAYINTMTDEFVATLTKTLKFTDGCTDNDACIDHDDATVLWTIGHETVQSGETRTHHTISKWNLLNQVDNGDGTFSPELLHSVTTPIPSTDTWYYQGCKIHDGMLWYASGYTGSSRAYVHACDPYTGEILYTIDCNTTAEPEGIAWVAEESAPGGYALYVGFAGMMLRRYTFGLK